MRGATSSGDRGGRGRGRAGAGRLIDALSVLLGLVAATLGIRRITPWQLTGLISAGRLLAPIASPRSG